MRLFTNLAVAVAMLVVGNIALAADLKSGPQVGDELGPYHVVKVAGAKNDGVEDGKELCYRCKLGNRPVVVVFARKTDAHVAKLAKELDKLVAANSEKKLASFVNLLGADAEALKTTGKQFATENNLENVAIVVPTEHDNGPAGYSIAPGSDVTVLIYKGGVVAANHALSADKLDDEHVAAIVKDTDKILN